MNSKTNIFLIYPCQSLKSEYLDINHLQIVQMFFPKKPTFTVLFGLN